MRLAHINLIVADPERAASFYTTHLMPAGETVWLGDSLHLRDTQGSDMAFQAGMPSPQPGGAHHGFVASSADAIDALAQRLETAGIGLIENDNEAGFRAIKFHDLDGYICEVYWEAGWPASAAQSHT